jgi:hypothetical protein
MVIEVAGVAACRNAAFANGSAGDYLLFFGLSAPPYAKIVPSGGFPASSEHGQALREGG